MKILKTAEQRNFKVDVSWYSDSELVELCAKDYSFDLTEIIFGHHKGARVRDYDLRINCDDCTEIRVEYNRILSCYITVAILKDGDKVIVSL